MGDGGLWQSSAETDPTIARGLLTAHHCSERYSFRTSSHDDRVGLTCSTVPRARDASRPRSPREIHIDDLNELVLGAGKELVAWNGATDSKIHHV